MATEPQARSAALDDLVDAELRQKLMAGETKTRWRTGLHAYQSLASLAGQKPTDP